MSTIQIYKCRSTPKNPYKYMVEIGNVIDRHLRRLGVRELLATRSMTFHEEEKYKKSWRELTFRYKDAAGLLEDELILTQDQNWIKELTEKLNQHEPKTM